MLFNLFQSKIKTTGTAPEIKNESTETSGFVIYINFNKDNDLLITADFNENADLVPSIKALHMLSQGKLLPSILESLLKNSNTHERQIYLQQILLGCNLLLNNNNLADPIIKPSDVFVKKNEK